MTAAPSDDLRLHAPADARPRAGGEFVLYWMQATMRAHDNFALNYAIERADELGLPVLVYHGLRHDYPWASDRFHTWILESVADLYADFEAKGIQYAFWLDRARGEFTEWPAGRRETGSGKREVGSEGGAGSSVSRFPFPASPMPLVSLARRAALVVTDYFPTFIMPRQVRGLREKVETPVIAVDSCTVVPLGYHDKEHSTARGIRPVLMEALPHYLWPVANPEPRVRGRVSLEFEPTVIRETGSGKREAGSGRSIAELVAGCDVDHGV
ncbi:MAG TPA: deoxyribodipyrimidine photo-lyase, partial [Gemmatimonadales bacterium]|nr:deoxyribodipyrimidine photo-lyase [Gemmatimonadales bacterium]